MARETKIGMVVGIGFIVCFAIVLSHRGQLTGVEDNPSFEIESILSESTAQSDSEQVRRSAREIGQRQPAPSRRRTMNNHTTAGRAGSNSNAANAESAERTVSGGDDGSRRTEPVQESMTERPSRDDGSIEETPRRFADGQPTRRMGDSPPGPGRFSARRDPIPIESNSKPVATPIDLTSGDSQFEAVNPPNRDDDPGDRLASSAPTAHIRPPRTESMQAPSVAPIRDRNDGVATLTSDELRERFTDGSPQPIRRSTTPDPRQPMDGQPRMIGEHLIESGDTLVRIARRYYQSDDPSVITAIFEANRDKLQSPDRIVANRRLQLPLIQGHANNAPAPITAPNSSAARDEPNVESGRTVAPAPGKQQPPLHRDPKRYYEIQSGDTLGGIAKKQYGTAHPDVLKQIQQANPRLIPDLNTVVQGRRIELPPIDGLTDHLDQVAPPKARLASATTVERSAPAGDADTTASNESTEARRDWRWYELKKGDVYTKVASKLLGSSDRWTDLAEMNKDIFPDPSRIQYGVRIRVPIESEMIATTGTREG